MNATQTAITESLTNRGSLTVATLVDLTGKSETTVRKNLKELKEQGTVENHSSEWFLVQAAEDEVEVEEPTTRRYTRHTTPTTRTVRTNQLTGAKVQVIRADEVDENLPMASMIGNGKWVTICHTHNEAQTFSRVLDAHYASSYPTFCPECSKNISAEAVGRRRKK